LAFVFFYGSPINNKNDLFYFGKVVLLIKIKIGTSFHLPRFIYFTFYLKSE
jgi:hypothetical protein